MPIISDRIREQLRARFEAGLKGPVQLTLYTRPGSSRLILPAGVGCATCEDAREMVEAVRDASPQTISLDVIDVTQDSAQASTITDVPTIVVGSGTDDARIRFQGLPAGTEFPALIDAVERVSRNEHGLSQLSLDRIARLTEPAELMVFATPT
jgi:alkyl hydroperoxide reductase subunit AhpF